MKKRIIGYTFTTTEIYKCGLCNKNLKGKEGYFTISVGSYYSIKRQRMCWGCMLKRIGEAKKIRKDGDRRYNQLVKKNVMKKLK